MGVEDGQEWAGAEVQERMAALVAALSTASASARGPLFADFKAWLGREIDAKGSRGPNTTQTPAFLLKRASQRLAELEREFSTGDEWRAQRALAWEGVVLEPVCFDFHLNGSKASLSNRVSSPTISAPLTIENQYNQHINVASSPVVRIKNLSNCTVSISACESLTLSSLSHCTVKIASANTLWATALLAGTLAGTVEGQTRIHESRDTLILLSTPVVTLEDCYNLQVEKGTVVKDFGFPAHTSEPSESFQWVNAG